MRPALIYRLALVFAALAAAASIGYAALSIANAPLDAVEGESLFAAQRLRLALALYTDPLTGVTDYGLMPTRFYVAHPPLWAWMVSWVPERSMMLVARTVACFSWFGLLAMIALRAPRERRGPSLPSGVAAGAAASAYTAAIFSLTVCAASARPDAFAIALAGAALVRSVERGRVDMIAAALFALAAWTKPNVVGLATGALVVQLLLDRKAFARAAAAALFVGGAIGFLMQYASNGAWITHVLRANAAPFTFRAWLDAGSRSLSFVAVPIAVGWVAAWRTQARTAGPRIAFGAIVASSAWALASSAKVGGDAAVWMEPMVAVCVVAAFVPISLPAGRFGWACAVAALVQASWAGATTGLAARDGLRASKEHRAFLARVSARCGVGADEVVLADAPGLEVMIDHRVLSQPFRFTQLANQGKFPLEPWIFDVLRPEARCLVMEDDLLERPLTEVHPERDRFGPAMRAVLRARFAPVDMQDGWRLYEASR